MPEHNQVLRTVVSWGFGGDPLLFTILKSPLFSEDPALPNWIDKSWKGVSVRTLFKEEHVVTREGVVRMLRSDRQLRPMVEI